MSVPALTCTLVACGTLLVYDYLCTLDQEIAYAWSPPWSAGTVLFFLNRYLPFVDTLISIKLKLTMSTPETCQREFTVVTWFIVAGIAISESILVLRTVAIWQARRIVLFVLSISCTVTFIPAIVITQIEIHSLKYIPSDIPGCRLASASSIILVAYILLAVSETTIFVLTIIAAHRSLRHSQAQWVIRLYKDGILFYVFMLGKCPAGRLSTSACHAFCALQQGPTIDIQAAVNEHD
ncbi:hypothetical protein CPC08DRAFT_195812 [Agrocybe pediades]|nr:hypothetical protein CPC08DRAFT_195812 [Agrocybe pediades]